MIMYQSADRTFTYKEIEEARTKFLDAVKNSCGKIRRPRYGTGLGLTEDERRTWILHVMAYKKRDYKKACKIVREHMAGIPVKVTLGDYPVAAS